MSLRYAHQHSNSMAALILLFITVYIYIHQQTCNALMFCCCFYLFLCAVDVLFVRAQVTQHSTVLCLSLIYTLFGTQHILHIHFNTTATDGPTLSMFVWVCVCSGGWLCIAISVFMSYIRMYVCVISCFPSVSTLFCFVFNGKNADYKNTYIMISAELSSFYRERIPFPFYDISKFFTPFFLSCCCVFSSFLVLHDWQ